MSRSGAETDGLCELLNKMVKDQRPRVSLALPDPCPRRRCKYRLTQQRLIDILRQFLSLPPAQERLCRGALWRNVREQTRDLDDCVPVPFPVELVRQPVDERIDLLGLTQRGGRLGGYG